MLVSIDGAPAGILGVEDPIRDSARMAVAELHRQGIRVIMLTGDNRTTAAIVANQLGIDAVEAEVSPESKGDFIGRLRREESRGDDGDGVNDAPPWPGRTWGSRWGRGPTLRSRARSHPHRRGPARRGAGDQARPAHDAEHPPEPLFAFVYNTLGCPSPRGALPGLGLLLNPMIASAAMTFSSVSVIANALRLRKVDL